MVRLPEDTQLSGFTPLMYGVPGRWCAPRALEPEAAHLAVRARALLFLGTQFLCGTDPPALASRLGATGVPEYVSVVQAQPAPLGRERVNVSVSFHSYVDGLRRYCVSINHYFDPIWNPFENLFYCISWRIFSKLGMPRKTWHFSRVKSRFGKTEVFV